MIEQKGETIRRVQDRRALKRWLGQVTIPILVFVAFVCVWHGIVIWRDIPKVLLPSPTLVWQAAIEQKWVLLQGVIATGKAATIGLLSSVVLGTFLAVLFSLSVWIRTAFYPYVIFLQTVPIVAVAPLLIIWLGNGFWTIVVVVIIISIFPIIANVTAGLISIDPNLLDLFRLHSASPWQTLIKLRIPTALSHLIVGMRISSGMAVIGAIVGEFFVGNGTSYDGLGSLMTRWQTQLMTDALIAAVGASTILGILFFGFVNILGHTFFRRWTTAVGFESTR